MEVSQFHRDCRRGESSGQRLWLRSGPAVTPPLSEAPLAEAAHKSSHQTRGDAVLEAVVVQSGRRWCRLCGEPVVLDDPSDAESWRHAEDLGDHTAET
jgi:hypothetical protein